MPLKLERTLLFIPVYNCERQIPRVITQLTPEVRALLTEVVIVNNRSTDGSQAAAIAALRNLPELPAKVLLNDENYGLGGSHKVAFEYALANGFDYCIVLHGDDQGDICDLAPLIRAGAHRQVECLLGARFMGGSRLEGYSKLRTFGNHVFNLIYSLAAGRRIHDLGSGLNLYAVPALEDRSFKRHANDLTFNYHMILHSIAADWRIRFFPITWREDDQISNVRLVRQSMRVLKIAVDYAIRRERYLVEDHSGRANAAYTATTVFSSGNSVGAAP
jgi:glycosyltransferase involved in cell wall biosynthesis